MANRSPTLRLRSADRCVDGVFLFSGSLPVRLSDPVCRRVLKALGMPFRRVGADHRGRARAGGSLHALPALGSALAAIFLGDTLLFLMGRHTG